MQYITEQKLTLENMSIAVRKLPRKIKAAEMLSTDTQTVFEHLF